ncbi:MAG: response regulator [Candidatus Kapabacteria bacterium]|nr:response regulator [Candidatus Kapabacteria bacterium]
MNLKILFVDDEEEILDSFRTMFIPFKLNWETFFANSAKEGLDILTKEDINIVISDMVMPEIDGLTFLLKVKSLYPHIIRIVLSGFSDYEKAITSTNVVHQFISKPCSAEDLILKINSLQEISDLLTDKNVIKFLNQIDKLPIVPDIYRKIEVELKKDDVSLNNIADIITKDIVLTAKILQIVNSAFFSIPIDVKDLRTAVNFLGINVIKSLVLASSFFDYSGLTNEEMNFLEKVWKHSLKVAQISSSLAKNSKLSKAIADEAYLIGLLHDIGKLSMLTNKDYSAKMLQFDNIDLDSFNQKEIDYFQTSHSFIGAYILGVWGLDNTTVKTILNHHNNVSIDWNNLTQQSILRIADITACNIDDDPEKIKNIKIDDDFINKFNEMEK